MNPQARSSGLTTFHTMKQHYFPPKNKTKPTSIVVIFLLQDIILASVFIIQTCLCSGQVPEMSHADYVYKNFFFLFLGVEKGCTLGFLFLSFW